MKKIAMILAAAALAFTACQDPEEKLPVIDVKMTSFVFKASENASLNNDVEGTISETAVSVVLPYGTDVTALVPTIEVSDDATISINDAPYVAGTPIDFTTPVDFLVSANAKSNKLYTVTCTEATPVSFTKVAETVASVISGGPVMEINPKNNLPYFVTLNKVPSGTSTMNVPVLFGYNGAGTIDSLAVLSEFKADGQTLAFGVDGTAYSSFYENGKKTSVVKYDGTTVSYLGESQSIVKCNTSQSNANGLCVFGPNDIYLASFSNAAGSSIARRDLNLCHWDGTDWTQEIGIPGRASGTYAYANVFASAAGKTYLMIYNQNKHDVSLYSFAAGKAGAESTLVENLKLKNPQGEEATSINLYSPTMTVGPDGKIYLLFAANYVTGAAYEYSPAVTVYNPATGESSLLGGVMTDIDISKSRTMDIAISPDGLPYVVYASSDDASNPMLRYFDKKTYQWSDPVKLSEDEADEVNIAFAANGVGYVSYSNETNDSLVVMQDTASLE